MPFKTVFKYYNIYYSLTSFLGENLLLGINKLVELFVCVDVLSASDITWSYCLTDMLDFLS